MSEHSRRDFFKKSGLGLCLFSLPTASCGQSTPHINALIVDVKTLKLTEKNIKGPFYRDNAPVRAKVTPPHEPGDVIVIKGSVYGFDSQKPLAHAVVDVWQADNKGHYDNDDRKNPPAKDFFKNRVRIITDANGQYEYESIKPAPYKIGKKRWRPSHIHYLVQAKGYKTLITQMYFKGDPHIATDSFVKQSLIVDMKKIKNDNGSFEEGRFDIVLVASR